MAFTTKSVLKKLFNRQIFCCLQFRIRRNHIIQNTLSRINENGEAIIYIHWPYCMKRCTYCNFNKYIHNNVNHSRMLSCLRKEIKYLLQLSGIKNIKSIYFGGGTPSLAKPSTINSCIECISDNSKLHDNAEITLECNPTNAESNLLRDFKLAGVNRLSIGIQALDNHDLKVMGRNHNSLEALKCLDISKNIFPGSTSLDMIFGRPGQSRQSWIEELSQILKLCDDHLSIYQLTVERGTSLFKQVKNKEIIMPNDDEMADMYEDTVKILTEANFSHYEVSNYARNGAESVHNSSYWNGTEYIGIGPGAHGRFICRGVGNKIREARIQTLEPDIWMYEVEKYGHGTRKVVFQSSKEILEELLMMGLRTKMGIDNKLWCKYSSGISLADTFKTSEILRAYVYGGFLNFDKMRLAPTEDGMRIADTITKDLLPYIKA
ncbi:radical S-adenosyl methionine domain-containing protein 1, mitochondrial-like isoform X1 [Centruroides sculpturatus]|uniref:radical S-adenosyl methionine domain-containing protein 1, mitochondrial-like isoform X1 n=2 Tax=Centruroides sculpturatus TaxID=218467 RepID=UPI000C6E781D|nr:radical S-adenosyl methionine domain-containing protein 1, mitochondrial-like isoform X1 [Centruroides sculpturatus]